MTEDEILAAEHALGLLTGQERRDFERRLAGDARLRAERAAWEERLASIAGGVPEARPPARVLRAVRARLFADRPSPGWNVAGWLWGLGGVVSAALVAAVLIFSAPSQTGVPGRIASEGGDLVLVALYEEGPGLLHLRREEGRARPGRALQLWIIGEGGVPQSLGVLPEAREAAFRIPESFRGAMSDAVLAVSDEPPGGSRQAGPSGDVLATGGLTEG